MKFDVDEIYNEYETYADQLRPHVIDTTTFLHKALKSGKSMLFEGAQGSLLDIDHGTFPYVTSSNSSGCGIHPGSGVPERAIEKMIGVVKAYTTRVGGGPCPTELVNEIGEHIRKEGNEFGTVTGRPRRCGWFDAIATGYGARISGVDCIAVMLLDVLSKLDEAARSARPTKSTASAPPTSPARSKTWPRPSRSTASSPAGRKTSPASAS
jgi:adenylosuccinate synthase